MESSSRKASSSRWSASFFCCTCARALVADRHPADRDHSFLPPHATTRPNDQHHVARRHRDRDRCDGRFGHHHGRERAQDFSSIFGRSMAASRTQGARRHGHRARPRASGAPLFFSLLVITVSFIPVFSLEAQEGRLFKPLAYTKTFSMFFAALSRRHSRAGPDDSAHPRKNPAAKPGTRSIAF